MQKEDLSVGCVANHFFDSGAYTLWTKAAEYAKENKCRRWDFYDTKEFWHYIDSYAEFVKKYKAAIDYYANVDVIPNPHLTLRNQKYLESQHRLKPVPVVHYTTDLSWLEYYINNSYEFIALGGLVGSTTQDQCKAWVDKAFDIVCNTPNRLPKVKIHGFGITSYEFMFRFPFFSVDSATWCKVAAFGNILMPHCRRSKFIFTEQPYVVKVSNDSPARKQMGAHFLTLSRAERAVIQAWLDHIGVPLGRVDKDGVVLEMGVMTHAQSRQVANLWFFEKMRAAIPPYPWSFRSKRRKGFGLC